MLAANVTAFLVALGFYPLAPLVVRYVQTPAAAGYGFGAPVAAAALMLTPFSVASFAAVRVARPLARRTSAELVVAASWPGHVIPDGAGYSAAALVSVVILIAAFAVSAAFAMAQPSERDRRPRQQVTT